MPLAWKGRVSRRWNTRSVFSSNAIACVPSRRRPCSARIACSCAGMASTSTVSGSKPGQAEQHRLVAAVPLAGGAQRPVELRANALRRVEQAVVRQAQREQPRGAHRPDGVRTARPDADLEEVEDRDGHGGGSSVAAPTARRGGPRIVRSAAPLRAAAARQSGDRNAPVGWHRHSTCCEVPNGLSARRNPVLPSTADRRECTDCCFRSTAHTLRERDRGRNPP